MPDHEFPQSAEDLGDLRQLYQHTVPIIDYDRARPSVVGSGVFAVVDRFHFVLTAAHVFESAFSKVAFGHLGTNGFEVFGASDMPILKARAQSGAGDDGLDLAVIEPTEEVLERLQTHYRPFDLRQALVSSSTWSVVSGWPARKNIYDSKKRRCYFDTCYHIQCPVADSQRLHQTDWNADVFIGLLAHKAKDFVSATSGQRIHLPNLEGVSGAGVWMRSSLVEQPHPTSWSLAGIVVEDHESKRMLKAIKIEHVWAPLRQGWELTKTT
jgi:hypothetical protein